MYKNAFACYVNVGIVAAKQQHGLLPSLKYMKDGCFTSDALFLGV